MPKAENPLTNDLKSFTNMCEAKPLTCLESYMRAGKEGPSADTITGSMIHVSSYLTIIVVCFIFMATIVSLIINLYVEDRRKLLKKKNIIKIFFPFIYGVAVLFYVEFFVHRKIYTDSCDSIVTDVGVWSMYLALIGGLCALVLVLSELYKLFEEISSGTKVSNGHVQKNDEAVNDVTTSISATQMDTRVQEDENGAVDMEGDPNAIRFSAEDVARLITQLRTSEARRRSSSARTESDSDVDIMNDIEVRPEIKDANTATVNAIKAGANDAVRAETTYQPETSLTQSVDEVPSLTQPVHEEPSSIQPVHESQRKSTPDIIQSSTTPVVDTLPKNGEIGNELLGHSIE